MMRSMIYMFLTYSILYKTWQDPSKEVIGKNIGALLVNTTKDKILGFKFLMTGKAKEIYKKAYNIFINYEVKYKVNQIIYDNARDFLERELEKYYRVHEELR